MAVSDEKRKKERLYVITVIFLIIAIVVLMISYVSAKYDYLECAGLI